MPTPIVSGQKTAFIALVNTVNPLEALRLADILINYEDIPTAIGRQLNAFGANPQYLFECMNCFLANDADLRVAGVYNNNTDASLLDTPYLFVNFTSTGGITYTGEVGAISGLMILGNSNISNLTIPTLYNLEYLYIGPGSTLNIADSSATSSFINNITVDFVKSRPGKLNTIAFESNIGNVNVVPGAYYGGISTDNPTATCSIPVTALAASDITNDSIILTWTAPASGYTLINTFYKKIDSGVWLPVTEENGDWIYTGDVQTGFVFRNLEAQTHYNFKVTVTCNNGGVATTTLDAATICCGGSGGSVTIIQKVLCQIVAEIVVTPDGSTQTLDNGSVIPLQYATGTTLTMPILIGNLGPKNIVVDGNNFQQFPFDSTTGTFNAAASPLANFNPGSIVTFEVNLMP